jgi:hypothetical protein
VIHPPITAAEVPPEWIADVRAIALRDGHAVRAGAEATIEVQSINTGLFGRLMLPGSGHHFTSEAERDGVLREIIGEKP